MKHPRIRELTILLGVFAVYFIGLIQLQVAVFPRLLAFAAIFLTLHIAIRFLAPAADPIIVGVAGLLTAIGLLEIAAIDLATISAGEEWKALESLQIAWAAVGVLGAIVILVVFRNGLGVVSRYRYTFALLGIAALVSPMIPYFGYEINGAQLWLRLGPLSFQPGEASKVFFIMFLAAYLAERRELLGAASRWRIGPIPIPDPKYLAPLVAIVALAIFIFVQQNDLGSSLLFFASFIGVLWIATGRAVYPVFGLGMFAGGVYIAVQTLGRIGVRFDSWLNPELDPVNSGFQALMGQYAMAEGGMAGVGLSGAASQPNVVPFAWTDYILAAIGHNMGLAGVIAVIIAFLVLFTRMFYVALRSRSDLNSLIVAGLGVVTAVQATLIAGGVLRVLPLTGVTLPFVSYGGSSLLANFVVIGIVLAVSNNEKTTTTSSPKNVEPTKIQVA